MLDIDWYEMMIIEIVMIVVVGKKDLKKMIRELGKENERMRKKEKEFRNKLKEELKEEEIEEVKKIIDEERRIDKRKRMKKVFEKIRSDGEDLRYGIK